MRSCACFLYRGGARTAHSQGLGDDYDIAHPDPSSFLELVRQGQVSSAGVDDDNMCGVVEWSPGGVVVILAEDDHVTRFPARAERKDLSHHGGISCVSIFHDAIRGGNPA